MKKFKAVEDFYGFEKIKVIKGSILHEEGERLHLGKFFVCHVNSRAAKLYCEEIRSFHVTITYESGLATTITHFKAKSKANALFKLTDRADVDEMVTITVVEVKDHE